MIDTLPRKSNPAWLARLSGADIERGDFSLDHVLADSAFCAGMGLAGTPVEILGHNVASFIYADHRVSSLRFRAAILDRDSGFRGYRVLGHADVSGQIQDELLYPDFDTREFGVDMTERERINHEIEFVKNPRESWAMWVVFDRRPDASRDHRAGRVSLLFIAEDPVRVFLSLYRFRAIRPEVLCLDGFSGNWTDLHDPDAALGQAVRANPAGLPRYLALFDTDRGHLIRRGPAAWRYRDEKFITADRRAGVWARAGSEVGPAISRDLKLERIDR